MVFPMGAWYSATDTGHMQRITAILVPYVLHFGIG